MSLAQVQEAFERRKREANVLRVPSRPASSVLEGGTAAAQRRGGVAATAGGSQNVAALPDATARRRATLRHVSPRTESTLLQTMEGTEGTRERERESEEKQYIFAGMPSQQ